MFESLGRSDAVISAESDYNVDIVMVIDATAGMSLFIDEIQGNALHLYRRFRDDMEFQGKLIKLLRIKIIPFRDYKYDGGGAMDDSGFFVLPEQNAEFEAYAQGIDAAGAGRSD